MQTPRRSLTIKSLRNTAGKEDIAGIKAVFNVNQSCRSVPGVTVSLHGVQQIGLERRPSIA
jgi:hypothetical protein